MTERKTQNRPETKELINTGSLLAELDEQIKFDVLAERVGDLIDMLKHLEQKFDKLDDKFQKNISESFGELDEKITDLTSRLEKLSKDLSVLEERVKNILDNQKNNWVNTFILLTENKNTRIALIFILGWTVHSITPDAWSKIIEIVKFFSG